jgi:hypothetical protein
MNDDGDLVIGWHNKLAVHDRQHHSMGGLCGPTRCGPCSGCASNQMLRRPASWLAEQHKKRPGPKKPDTWALPTNSARQTRKSSPTGCRSLIAPPLSKVGSALRGHGSLRGRHRHATQSAAPSPRRATLYLAAISGRRIVVTPTQRAPTNGKVLPISRRCKG